MRTLGMFVGLALVVYLLIDLGNVATRISRQLFEIAKAQQEEQRRQRRHRRMVAKSLKAIRSDLLDVYWAVLPFELRFSDERSAELRRELARRRPRREGWDTEPLRDDGE